MKKVKYSLPKRLKQLQSSPGPCVFSCEILGNFVQHVCLYLVWAQALKKKHVGNFFYEIWNQERSSNDISIRNT